MLLFRGPARHFVATDFRRLGAANVAANLHLLNVAFFVLGAVGALGMVVFDIVLGRTGVSPLVRDVTLAAAFFATLLGVLRSGGVDPLSLVTTSAVATAALGLASQGLMANVAAGLALQFERTLLPGNVHTPPAVRLVLFEPARRALLTPGAVRLWGPSWGARESRLKVMPLTQG